MKGYFISTTALICLLMLSMYPLLRNLETGCSIKKDGQQDQQGKHISSVLASENRTTGGDVQFAEPYAGVITSADISVLQKRNLTEKYRDLFFEPFGKTKLQRQMVTGRRINRKWRVTDRRG